MPQHRHHIERHCPNSWHLRCCAEAPQQFSHGLRKLNSHKLERNYDTMMDASDEWLRSMHGHTPLFTTFVEWLNVFHDRTLQCRWCQSGRRMKWNWWKTQMTCQRSTSTRLLTNRSGHCMTMSWYATSPSRRFLRRVTSCILWSHSLVTQQESSDSSSGISSVSWWVIHWYLMCHGGWYFMYHGGTVI